MPLISGRQALPFDPRTVGERFMFEREKLDISRADLAALCDYSAEQVRRIERGEQVPGARLLAALADAGGDVRSVLLGAGHEEKIPEMDLWAAAELRDRVRREAREYARLKADRRKKVLNDDEADLVDAFRELSSAQRDQAVTLIQTLKRGLPIGGSDTIIATHGSAAAGGDQIINPPPRRKR